MRPFSIKKEKKKKGTKKTRKTKKGVRCSLAPHLKKENEDGLCPLLSRRRRRKNK
jgi:hypothetical protein